MSPLCNLHDVLQSPFPLTTPPTPNSTPSSLYQPLTAATTFKPLHRTPSPKLPQSLPNCSANCPRAATIERPTGPRNAGALGHPSPPASRERLTIQVTRREAVTRDGRVKEGKAYIPRLLVQGVGTPPPLKVGKRAAGVGITSEEGVKEGKASRILLLLVQEVGTQTRLKVGKRVAGVGIPTPLAHEKLARETREGREGKCVRPRLVVAAEKSSSLLSVVTVRPTRAVVRRPVFAIVRGSRRISRVVVAYHKGHRGVRCNIRCPVRIIRDWMTRW